MSISEIAGPVADTSPAPDTGVAAASGPAPAVSVLVAVHNGERYLESALRSVMDQTLREIEIVVVDDCSTDTTPAILTRLAAEDPRLRVVTAPTNMRLAGALNLGLAHVRAPLVARMDDDDLSLPERLAIQKRYLDAHPDVTLLGTSFERIHADGQTLRRTMRSRDDFALRWALRFSPQVSHPTFMFRKHLPDGTPLRYDAAFTVAQDYDLLCRLAYAGAGLACLPDVLLRYRVHDGSVSLRRRQDQDDAARRLGVAFQRRTLPEPVFDALAPFRACFFDFAPATPERITGSFAGARAMLAHDIAVHPGRAAWLRRQTGQFLAWALQRGGASGRLVALAFLRHGPDMLPAMALRALETKGYLPDALKSDPDVRAPS